MASLETTLNAGVQAVQGQTHKPPLLKAANVGQNMLYLSISIVYFPKLCPGSHQTLNLSHPKKRGQSSVNKEEKLEHQQILTGGTVRRTMRPCCLQDNLFHFEFKSVG